MAIKTDLTRRSFIKSAAAGAGAAAVPVALTGCGGDDDNNNSLGVYSFAHGVASDAPLSDRVIIWSRITPENEDSTRSMAVTWNVSTSEDMANVVATGSVTTDKTKDFTLKADVTGLNAETTYYYQFVGPEGTESSPVGTTKTLPDSANAVAAYKLAVCSCANYPFGFFNVYEEISKSDADIVLHLGDYIYEYRSGQYPTTPADGRAPDPAKEVTTLADYRERYAQYRADVQLQAAHRTKPFICVWDDHELANDAYKDGAQNHNEGEGEFADRRRDAFQAYHEWMPIRTGDDQSIIDRNFQIGTLINLQMMDTRHIGRTQPLSYSNYDLANQDAAVAGAAALQLSTDLADRDMTLLGIEQRARAISNVVTGTATWDVLGQQVLMGRNVIPPELLGALGTLQELLEDPEADLTQAGALQTQISQTLLELATIKAGGSVANPGNPATPAEQARLDNPLPYNLDAWDGYGVEREYLLGLYAQNPAKAANAKNLIVLAGDTHNAWGSDLRLLNDNPNALNDVSNTYVGVELATASVTSPGFDEYITFNDQNPASAFEAAVTSLIDDLKYFDASRRGFMEIEFTPALATCVWKFVNTITTKENVEVAEVTRTVAASGITNATKLVDPAAP